MMSTFYKLSDDSQMPHGFHQGKKMSEVPPGYLLLIFESRYNKQADCGSPVAEYIGSRVDKLKKKVENGKQTIAG